MISANNKVAGMSMVERKTRYAVIAKVEKKTSKLVSSVIVDKLKPMAARVKTLTFDNDKEFAEDAHIDEQIQSTRPFTRWEHGGIPKIS